MKITIILCLIGLLNLSIHTDRPIKIDSDGKLIGLPKKYSPAYFIQDEFTLRIGENQIVLPSCITELYNNCNDFQILFASSWYHDTDLMPPYIHMDVISDKEYNIFFNLDTLEIFDIWEPELRMNEKEGNHFYTNAQEISDECRKKIKASITKM